MFNITPSFYVAVVVILGCMIGIYLVNKGAKKTKTLKKKTTVIFEKGKTVIIEE